MIDPVSDKRRSSADPPRAKTAYPDETVGNDFWLPKLPVVYKTKEVYHTQQFGNHAGNWVNFHYKFSIKLPAAIRVAVVRSRAVAADWRLRSGGGPGILQLLRLILINVSK